MARFLLREQTNRLRVFPQNIFAGWFKEKLYQLAALTKTMRIFEYHQTSNISRTLVGNKIVDHSDVVGAWPIGAAPGTSSFSA